MAKRENGSRSIVRRKFANRIKYVAYAPARYVSTDGKRATQNNIELSQDEIDLILKYRRLDERGKSAVLNTLEHEYSALPGGKAAADPRRA